MKKLKYDSVEAREEAKRILHELMEKHQDKDQANWFHVGSLESAKILGLVSLHSISRGLEHVGFGDFVDQKKGIYYRRVTDTKAGRIYHAERDWVGK